MDLNTFHLKFLVCFLLTLCISCGTEGPSPVRSPEEEAASFQLETGLKIQLVASEPMVQDPVFIEFDEDSRLWVVEMRGFMPDIDGKGESEKIGRLSVLEDLNGDGIMDHSHIFLDSLIMPRTVALVHDGVLIVENKSLWLAQDLDKNLIADNKILIDSTYAHSGLPEHTDNGLWRGMDNWYYSAKSRLRYQWINNNWVRDSTEFRGQWGICHDDEGRLFYNYNWSQLHADLVPPNYLSRNKNHTPTTGIDHGLTIDRRVYPIRANPAVNRGYIPGTLDSTGKLLEFTAACSPLVLRSRLFPSEYYHNAFVCEPSGNLVKRNIVEESGFNLTAHDPHPGKEFLASTDERFRPVSLCTGPDGALYIADMYRGLIQHGAYVTPYLREQTLTRKLIAPIHRGRIWRVVPENWKPNSQAKYSNSNTDSLVQLLSNINGWQRDLGQRLLVERGDSSAIPSLLKLIQSPGPTLPRNHALWTLAGLGWHDIEVLKYLISDTSLLVSNSALRLIEPYIIKSNSLEKQITPVLINSVRTAPIEQALQVALSSYILPPSSRFIVLGEIIRRFGSEALIRDAVLSSLENEEYLFLEYLLHQPRFKEGSVEKEILVEMLTTCIIKKGAATEMLSLLNKLNKPATAYQWSDKVILTASEVQSKNTKRKPTLLSTEPALFSRIDPDKRVHAQTQSIKRLFEWPGFSPKAEPITASTLNEDQQALFVNGRQHYLTTCAGCHGSDGAGINRFAPPLVGSSWVLGDERRLSLIILHGMEGPVEVGGRIFDAPDILPVMPAHSTMDDAAITAVLTYIRNEWGNAAGPMTKGMVGKTRHTTQGRVIPWTAKELDKFISSTQTTTTPETK